jgi:AcrR family transcriptional regulator
MVLIRDMHMTLGRAVVTKRNPEPGTRAAAAHGRRHTGRGRGTPAHRSESEAESAGEPAAFSALDGPGARILLAAAVDAMVEHGYHGTSVRDVAERAGMSPAALYHHFPSKQVLLFTIMDRGMDELIRRSEEAYATAPDDPAEKLRALVQVHVLRHIEHQKESFLGNSELRSLDEPGRGTVLAKRDRQMDHFYRAVRDGVERGHFRTRFPTEAARGIITMCTAVATWYHKTGPRAPDEIAHRYADIALAMVDQVPRQE